MARLSLNQRELGILEKDLGEILQSFKILEEVPAEVKPSFQPFELKNVTRKDEEEPSLTQEQALQNAKHKEKGYFKGPPVV